MIYLTGMFRFLTPPPDSTIPFLTLVSFLLWFIVSRLFVYNFPGIYLSVNDSHIHHYTYGIILLSILSFAFLAYPMTHRDRIRASIPLGIALALAYDEYAMWIIQGNSYYDRLSYDAIICITLILLNLTYFPSFWTRWGHRLLKLFNIIFLGIPVYFLKKLRKFKFASRQ